MKTKLILAGALAVSTLGGCAVYPVYPPGAYYYYDTWGYYGGGYYGDGRGSHRHSGGGRSEPGNESGMYPAHPGHGRGAGASGGGSRGGEAGSR